MKHWLTRIFLFLSGALLLGIGGSILLVPHVFYAGNGIVLGTDPSLLSEIRAPGGLLAGSGLLILLGAFRAGTRTLAMKLTVLVYGAFGLSRLLGLTLDGMPANGVIGATVIELVVAAIGIVLLLRRSGVEATESPQELASSSSTS